MFMIGRALPAFALAQILLASGCGTTYTFDIERVQPDSETTSPTTVDIVAIELEDIRTDASLKRVTAAEWFDFQYEQGHPMVHEKRVYSVTGLADDTVARVKIVHPDPVAWSAAIYLFAEVPHAAESLVPRHAYRITQLPPRGGTYTVRLKGDRMTVARGPYRGPKARKSWRSD